MKLFSLRQRKSCSEAIFRKVVLCHGPEFCKSCVKFFPSVGVNACKNCDVNEALGYLKKKTNLLKRKDPSGDLILHKACRMGLCVDMLEELVDLYPRALITPNDQGRLPLHEAAASSNRYVKSKIIEALLNRYPRAAKHVDEDGCLPLHHLAKTGNLESFRLLMRAYPAGMYAKNNDGMTPLHLYCQCDYPKAKSDKYLTRSIDLVKLIISHDPQSFLTPGQGGRLPLHFALESNLPSEAVEVLVKLCPGSLMLPDNQGRTPLHTIAARTCTPERCEEKSKLIRFIANAYPKAHSCLDRDGRLPLHLAVESGTQTSAIEFMLSVEPEQLQNALLMDLAIASQNVETMFLISTSNPSLLTSARA